MTARVIQGAVWVAVATAANAASAEPGDGAVVERDVIEVGAPQGRSLHEVAVDNRLGDVHIVGGDRESARVVAIKRAPDRELIERLKVTLTPDPSGVLYIDTAVAEGEGTVPMPAEAVALDLVIETPRDMHARVDIWRGRVRARDLDAGAELAASRGDIEVENVAGPVTARLVRGEQAFRVIFGAVDARGVEGEIVLHTVRGERLGVALHDGDVRGHGVAADELSILTTRGDIHLRGEATGGGLLQIASHEGSLDVRLEAEGPLALRASSRRGAVDVTGAGVRGGMASPGRYLGVVPGDGDPALVELSSRIGNVRFAVVQP